MPTVKEELESLTKTLQKFSESELKRLPKKFEGESMRRVFEPYQRLLVFCASAPQYLEKILDDVKVASEPGIKKNMDKLAAKGHKAAEKQWDAVIFKRIEGIMPKDGGKAEAKGKKAMKAASVEARQESMRKILLALSGAALGGLNHLLGAGKEIAEAAHEGLGVAKGTKKTYADLARRLQALDDVQSTLKDMCAILFLVPNAGDIAAKKTPDEATAMARLEAALAK